MQWIDRLFFPLLVFLSSKQSKKLGLTPIDDERINVSLRHAHGKILDIGCGDNGFAEKYGDNCVGVDVYRWKGSKDVTIVADSSNLPFKDETFDTVCFIASLNHIPNRVAVLKEANRVLKDDGQVLISMINPIVGYICHKFRYRYDRDQKERGMKEGELWGMWKWRISAHLTIAGFKIVRAKRFVWGLNRFYVGRKNG